MAASSNPDSGALCPPWLGKGKRNSKQAVPHRLSEAFAPSSRTTSTANTNMSITGEADTDVLSDTDIRSMFEQASMPPMHVLQEEAVKMANDVRIANILNEHSPSLEPTQMGSAWRKDSKSYCPEFTIHYHKTKSSRLPTNSLSRDFVLALLPVMRDNILEHSSSRKLLIKYAKEHSPISGAMLAPRRCSGEVDMAAITPTSLSELLRGAIESVRFKGVIKTKTRMDHMGKAMLQPGLACSADFFFSAWEDQFEFPHDRLARMRMYCAEGNYYDIAKNLRSMLSPFRLVEQFEKGAHEFPDWNNKRQLQREAYKQRDELSGEIDAQSRLQGFCSLLEAATNVVPDADMVDYCYEHFGLRDVTKQFALKLMSSIKALVNEAGREMLIKFRGENGQSVLPFVQATELVDIIDQALPINPRTGSEQDNAPSKWRFVCSEWPRTDSCITSTSFAAPDGDEEIYFIQLKKANTYQMLRNVGLVIGTSIDDRHWKDDKELSSNQRAIKALASEMCLNRHMDIMLESGMVALISPTVSRDVPEMVKACKDNGQKTGQGTMLVSKHLYHLAMTALNPKSESMGVEGVVGVLKNSAFVKRENLVVLPEAPGELFRQQGLSVARETKKYQSICEPEPTFRLDVHTHTDSLESRQTRSTGDVPKKWSLHRPNACDQQAKKPLKGILRSQGLQRHWSHAECIHGPTQELQRLAEIYEEQEKTAHSMSSADDYEPEVIPQDSANPTSMASQRADKIARKKQQSEWFSRPDAD
mmetsp:Transcript_60981/g.108388  ORF Transcript_60981/g.108388 Transcript_60981/m.108388 type:complete len:759 (-) Transcript_60981:59-2335(-)